MIIVLHDSISIRKERTLMFSWLHSDLSSFPETLPEDFHFYFTSKEWVRSHPTASDATVIVLGPEARHTVVLLAGK